LIDMHIQHPVTYGVECTVTINEPTAAPYLTYYALSLSWCGWKNE